jgi:hypothetical protein
VAGWLNCRYDYWRNLFPKVTEEAIRNFQAEYQGSEEETGDVISGKSVRPTGTTRALSFQRVCTKLAGGHGLISVCGCWRAAYNEFEGNMSSIIDNVMLATDGEFRVSHSSRHL